MSEYPSISMNGEHFWIMQSHIVCVLAQIAVKLVSLQQQQQRQQQKEQQLKYNFIFGAASGGVCSLPNSLSCCQSQDVSY